MSLFDLPAHPEVPVAGETDTYPVRRIFCVGRNYADHAKEMGHAPTWRRPSTSPRPPRICV